MLFGYTLDSSQVPVASHFAFCWCVPRLQHQADWRSLAQGIDDLRSIFRYSEANSNDSTCSAAPSATHVVLLLLLLLTCAEQHRVLNIWGPVTEVMWGHLRAHVHHVAVAHIVSGSGCMPRALALCDLWIQVYLAVSCYINAVYEQPHSDFLWCLPFPVLFVLMSFNAHQVIE